MLIFILILLVLLIVSAILIGSAIIAGAPIIGLIALIALVGLIDLGITLKVISKMVGTVYNESKKIGTHVINRIDRRLRK